MRSQSRSSKSDLTQIILLGQANSLETIDMGLDFSLGVSAVILDYEGIYKMISSLFKKKTLLYINYVELPRF